MLQKSEEVKIYNCSTKFPFSGLESKQYNRSDHMIIHITFKVNKMNREEWDSIELRNCNALLDRFSISKDWNQIRLYIKYIQK